MWSYDRGVRALRVSGHAHMVCTHSVSGKPIYVEPTTAMPAILSEEPYEITFRRAYTTLLHP